MKKIFLFALMVMLVLVGGFIASQELKPAVANGPAEKNLESRIMALEASVAQLVETVAKLAEVKPVVTKEEVVSVDVAEYSDVGAVTCVTVEAVEATVTGTGIVDPLIQVTGFPLPKAGEEFKWDRAPVTVLELAQSGAHIQGLGIGNMSSAVSYKGPDGAVPSTAVLQDGVVLDFKRQAAVGTMVLYDTKGRILDLVQDYSYRGIVYWAQIVRAEPTSVVSGMRVHWKSAKDRKPGTVIPAGEIFTIFFLNVKESDFGKDNGTEACGTVFPVLAPLQGGGKF